MEGDTTHFNAIVIGTGLTESILSAALSKAGYTVVQIDQAAYYGDQWASLTLSELVAWSLVTPGASCTEPSESLLRLSNRFSLSLRPTLLRATGEAIDLLVRSKVAAYLQFGTLSGIALWSDQEEEGKLERVPGSKADVFNDASLSLVEKRRLTKLLLFVVGEESLEESSHLRDPTRTFLEFLATAFSLSPKVSRPLAYALALCTSDQDLALPALRRLRSFLRSTGRYGPSPFLMGHYGGAGDLVGGFSRVCAVWGGGQILGRPIFPLVLNPEERGSTISETETELEGKTPSLGVDISVDPSPVPPMRLTADWVIASPSHLPILFPSSASTPQRPHSVHAIIVLPSAISFPHPTEGEEEEEEGRRDKPDSSLFIFEPRGIDKRLGTVTALQVGSGTFACPEGYYVLYLQAPILDSIDEDVPAVSLLEPYLNSLLSLSPTPLIPLLSSYHFRTSPTPFPPSFPSNFLIVPPLASDGSTATLTISLDESVIEAERLFWLIVGERGLADQVEFFAKEVLKDLDEEE